MMKYLGLPFLASDHGKQVDNLLLYVHYLMGALFVGWLAYFLYAIFRFRASKHPHANYSGAQTHASSYIEVAVAAIEGVLLVGLSIPLWAKFADKFPAEDKATVVRVVAEQFLWNGVYPGKDGKFGKQSFALVNNTNQFGWDYSDEATHDNFVSDPNELMVPEKKPVIAYISSKDVIHSFKINPFRVTQDAIPGMAIPIWFQPTTNGTFLINCAQLCGNSHYFMKGRFHVVPQEKYDEFVAAKTASAGTTAQSFE
jgi:cytochrome c oxidase subunit II